MYIGRYTPYYYSFATNPNLGCTDGVGGKKQWGGQTSSGIGFGTGKDCTAARQDFCNKYGKNGKCYGDIGGPPHDDPNIPSQQNAANRSNSGGGNGTPKTGLGKICGPPKSGDPISYWNYLACSFESSTGLPDYGLTIIAGIGGLLVLGLLTRRR